MAEANLEDRIKTSDVQPISKEGHKYWRNRVLPQNYYNYFDLCKILDIESTRAKNVIAKAKVNGIKNIPEFEPVAHLFEVFEKPIKGGFINQYGIKRVYWDYFREHGEAPVVKSTREKKRNMDEHQFCNINVTKFPRELYYRFKNVVDYANAQSYHKVGYHAMVAVAVHEWVERNEHIIHKAEAEAIDKELEKQLEDFDLD